MPDAPDRLPRFAAGLAFLLASGLAVALPQHAPVPGGVAVLRLESASAPAPGVHFAGRPQPVVRTGDAWFALIGIPLDAESGKHEAMVTQAGVARPMSFAIRPKHYPAQRLRIPDRRMVEPPPELAARIAAEQQRLQALKTHFSPAPAPDADFILPADGRLSGRFGLRRILNGQPRAPHAGLDVAVARGTPVRAAAPGTVLAVEDFYFAGKTVVVDHGQGLLTLYAHLAHADVVAGQTLRRGEALGASGASGRATGPHRHWGVLLGGTSVDPELFLFDGR